MLLVLFKVLIVSIVSPTWLLLPCKNTDRLVKFVLSTPLVVVIKLPAPFNLSPSDTSSTLEADHPNGIESSGLVS